LTLSAEQKGRIAELLEERTTALAEATGATDEQRAAITEASDEKLAAVLSEVQLGDFLGKPVETRMQFSFRFQKWDDVLIWFAEQAEMSLVLRAPPPGTFNYSDTREYTPREAIDMLNGVLITKGFTLIRRGRMLMVIDLVDGIPDGLVQQVPLDDVDKHGKFEFVKVQFPLGRRSPEAVEAAIKPLLSQYHKIVLVTATQTVLVTDMAGIMRTVGEVIEAISEPKPPDPQPKPRPPEYPELRTYELKTADPDTVVSVLSKLISSAQVSVDPNTDMLNAYATPSQHNVVAKIVEQMEGPIPPDKKRVLEVYSIDAYFEAGGTTPYVSPREAAVSTHPQVTQLLETLQSMVPDAQLNVNSEAKTLVAWATPTEHETIKTALEKLEVDRGAGGTRQLEVHRLTKMDPDTTLELFREILPDARLAVDAQTRSLIAVAVPADQEVIRNTLKTLQPAEPGPDTPELRFYELTLAMPPDFPEMIQKVAPNGTVALDQSGMRLMVIASPTEHAKVDKTIQNMQKTTFEQGRPKLVFYPVTPSQRRRFEAVWQSLSKELPGVELVTDGQPGELAIWGRSHQHEVITEIMEELKRDVPEAEKFQLMAYPIKSDDPSGVISMLTTLYPETNIVLDSGGDRLLVWTSQQEHESIKKSLEELKATGSETAPTVEIYPLTKADPTSTLALLQSLAPDATLSLDAKSENIVALATAEDHLTIKTTLEKLQPTEPDPNEPQLQFYAFDGEPPTNLVTILQAQAPKAEITVDSENKRLVVLASPSDHTALESMIQKFQESSPSDQEPELVLYPLKTADPTSALTLLQKLVPDAELSLDTKNENLTAIAVPADHETIKKTLDTLESAAAGPDAPQLQFYPFPKQPAADLVSILQTQLPKANITVDSENKRLVVFAAPTDHESIKSIIQKYEEATPDDGQTELVVYPIKATDAASALTFLQQLVPEAQLSLDAKSENLMAVATAKDHDTIKKTLETLESAAADADAPQLQFYVFEEDPPANLTTILQNLAPKAEITPDAENKRLMVMATTSDHEKIKATVEQFQQAVPAKGKPELAVYPIKSVDPSSVLSMLQQLYPDQQILLDSTSKRLLVWASAEDQASITKSLEQLTGASLEETPQLEIYRLTKADPDATLSLLQKLAPEAQLTLDSNTNNLIALAVPADQQIIKSTIEQLQPDASDPDTKVLQFHSLSREPSDNLVTVLTNLAPQAEITADAENERLMVVATAADHEMIKGVIEEFEASTPPEEKGKLAVYPVSPAQRRRFEAALEAMAEDLPSVQVLPTSEPGELAIWAKPTEHLQVAEVLKELEGDVPADEKPQLMAYTLKSAEPAAVAEVLTKLFPDIEVVTDEKTRKVMVWALPADQPRISTAVQQIDSGEPGEWEEIFKAHAVPDADLTVASQMIQQLLPDIRLSSDTKAGTILAWGTKADHDKIAKVLEEMQTGRGNAATAVIYTLEVADAQNVTSVLTLLGTAYPNARFSAGTQPGQVVAWANSKDHEQIKTLIEQMGQQPSFSEVSAALYHLKSITAANAEQILQTAVPRAKVVLDADNPKRLIVWGGPSDHETIDGILKEIDVEGEAETSSKAVVYTFQGMDASGTSYAITFLTSAFPEARFTTGVEPGQVAAWASAKDHEQIKTLVDQLSQKSASDVSVYILKSITAASAMEVLQSALPQAKFTADAENPRRLTAWASQPDHEKIKTIIEKIDVESTADPNAPTLQLYDLEEEPPTHLVTILQSLAPEAEITADAENKRLAVLASPADQDKIKAAVEQFQQASPAKGRPELAVYKIRSADPTSVVTMLQTLYPDRQFVLDAKTDRLMAWASAEDQKSIKESLEQITGTADDDEQSLFQSYPIRGITSAAGGATLVSTLQPLVPDAKLTVATDFKNLIVWATPTEHEVIRQAVEQLGHGASVINTPQLEVYHLTKANPDTTLTLLEKLVPDAQISLDPQTNNLIALAIPADQQVIKATLEQLQPGASGPDTPELRFHALSREPTDDLVSVLKELVPQAQITADAENKRLTVVATPTDHETIKKVVDDFETSTPPEERGTLTVYPATPAQQRRFEAALGKLTEELPSVQVLPNSEPGELAIWAIPTEHIRVAELLKQLEGDVSADERPRLAAYTLKAAEPAAVSELITRLFPDVDVVIDEKTRKVMVWAPLEDQGRISEAIEQIDSGKPGEWEEIFKAYPLPDADPTVATQMLQQLLPDVRLSSDATAGTILAWGTKKDHETIAQMLEEVQAAPNKASTAVVYTLKGADATNTPTIVSFLGTAFPNARFTPGAQPGQLVAWASSKDQEQIKTLVDQLTQGEDSAPKVAVYDLKSVTAASAEQIVQTAVPQATITVDPENPQRLTVWARPSEHETIASIVQEIDVEGDVELTSQAVVYSLEGMDAAGTSYAVTFLTSTFPKARFTQGVEPGQVVAWASTKEHQGIKTLVDQLTQKSTTDVAVYSLKFITAASALEVLQSAVPQAKLTVDSEDPQRLTAMAKSEDHEALKKIIETIDVEGATDSAAKAVIYALDPMDASAASYALTFLTTAFPKARFVAGARPGQVVAWATAKDHAEIKNLIDQMIQEPAPELAHKVAVYDLKSITPASAQTILQTAVPQATITADPENPQRLTVWARPSEQETIASIVQEIDVEGDGGLTSQAVVYSLQGMDAAGTSYAVTFLTSTFPKARFTQGVEPGQVVAWASTKEHQGIKTLVDQLTQKSTTDVAVYSLKFITAASALEVLQSAVPQAKLTVDAEDPQRLTALAKSEDHEALKKIIATIDVEGETELTSQAVVYSLKGMDATGTTYAVSFLTTAFPKARFTQGVEPGQVVAWASAKEHQEIKTLVDQLTQTSTTEVAVYSLKSITAASALEVLQSAVPQAKLTVDSEDPRRLTALAKPEEHEALKKIIETIDVEGDVESSSTAVVYTLEGVDAAGSTNLLPFLTGAFPKAQFSQGVEPGQVVAWATTKEHEQIKALIEQLAQASPDTAQGAAVYSLKFITASDAMQVLQMAVPQAKFTPNASDPQRLTAWARESHQEAIKNVLEIIDVEGDAESSSKAVIYTIKGMDTRSGYYKLRFLGSAFPNASFTMGAEGDQIVAWATAKDHEEIKNLIDQFGEEAASEIVVYSLKNISATNASTVLQTAVPQAEITVDTDNPQRLTAWARQEDHDAIQKILTTIDIEGDADSSATVVVYTMEGMSTMGGSYAVGFFSTTFPKARFTAGVEPGQIVAWASAKDHEQIKALVDQMTREPESDVAVYSLKAITAANAVQVLQLAVPNAKLTEDIDDPQRLTAVASAEDHEAIKKIIETIDVAGEVDSAAKVAIYTVKGLDSRRGYYKIRFLTNAFPKASFTSGGEPDEIVAWATPKEHERIKEIIEQLGREEASEIVVYSLKNTSGTNASNVLQRAVPRAEITVDADNPQRLTAWARQEDHDTIQKILATIDVEGAADSAATAVIYTLQGVDAYGATYAVRFLTTAFPEARIVSGAQPSQVVAWATPKDHAEIKNLIDQMSQGPPKELAPKLTVYGLKFISAADASQVLQTALPQAKFTVSTDDPQRLAAWARPSEHETITAILQELDVEGDAEITSTAVVYTMEGMSYSGASYAVRFLTTAFPKARFTAGAEPGQVVAWASAKDHEQIKALVDQMTEEPESDVAVYSLTAITAASVVQVLQSAVPNAKLTADTDDPRRLTAVASTEDHEAIKKIIETIDVEGATDPATAVIYTIKGMDTRSGYYKLRFLSGAFPQASFTMGAEGDQIVAWATAKDHEKIKALIDQFGEEAASEIVVYSLKNISATSASGVLQTAVPQAEITVDTDNPQRLTAWARQQDHDTIQKILTTIDIEGDADTSATAVVYRMEGMTSSGAMYAVRFLMTTFPKARFTVGVEPGQVVAWASAKDHEQIKTLVDQMTEKPESDVAVYSLKSITAASALEVLQSAVPNAKLTADTDDPQRLTAVASTQDHVAIKKIIETIDVEGAVDSAATALIYTMKGMDATSGSDRISFLSSVFPNASFTQGAEADQIVAWATAKDHEKIKSLIDQFDEEAASEIVLYSLQNISATSASTVLETAVPQAEITVDTDNPQRLTAWARQEDHGTIQKILTTIDVEDDADSSATAVVYKLGSKTLGGAMYAVRFLTTTFPKARFTLGVEPGQVVAWASAKDHDQIRSMVDKINEEPESDVAVYSLKSITAASALEVLQSAVPDAQLTADADDPQRLTAWAEAADHETIKKVLETIDVEGADDSAATAVIYTLKGVDASTASSAVTFLADVFPQARIVSGAQPDQVVAWATPKDHEEIKSLVEKFGQETAAEIVLYTLKNISASNASTVLQTAVPQAKLTVDTEDPQRLTAFARPSDHEAIKAILDKIDVESDAEFAAKVVIYTLEGMDVTAAGQTLDFLTATFPDARFALGAEAGQMVAWAAAKDHEEIKALVDQLNQGPSEETAPKASVYALKNISAADAMQVLEAAVPQAIFTAASDDPQRLTAWARPSEHDTITAILAEIDIEGDAGSASKVAIYTLKGMDSRSVYYALRFLMGVFPNARFTQGTKEDQVVAWATAKDQEQIKSLIDQLGQAEATNVVIYTLEGADMRSSAFTLRFLMTAFPAARFAVGSEPTQLLAWASAEDHVDIKAVIEQLNQGPPADQAQKIAVYVLKNITAQSAVEVLTTAVPMAKVTVDAGDPQRLNVWARPSEHEAIDGILKEIDVEGDAESASRAGIYTLKGVDSRNVFYTLRFLMGAFPDARFTQGAQADQVVAWATAKDHEQIKTLVEQMGQEATSEIVVYTLEGMDPRFGMYTTNFLSTTFPKAQFTMGTQPGQVVARATAEDHVEIKALIDQMNQGPPPTEAQATVYTVKNISAQSAIEVLTSAVPTAKLSVDAGDPQRLTAWARPSEHQMIDTILQDIDIEGDPESASKAVVYTMEGMDSRSSLYTLRFLGQAFPDAQFTQGAQADQVVAWAAAKDHAKIESLVEQLGQEAASEVVLYTLKNIAAASAAEVLQTAVPEAELTVDTEDPQRLTAWARATDHDTIKTILEKIDLESDPDSGARVVIYTLEGLDSSYSTYTTSFLTATFPKARFTMGTQPGQLIAWASAKDHEEIKALIDQMNQGPPPDQARTASVYMVKNISAADAMQVLQNAVPLADFSPASDDPQRLTALARPSEHEMIDTILGEIDVEGDPESASKAMVYTMEGMDSQNVSSTLSFLGQAFPDAQFAQGAQADQIVAWASAKDHEKIESLVEQLGQEAASQIVVYMLKNISGNEAVEVLQSALPEAVLTLATDDPKRLTAWARPLDHQKIDEILKEIDIEADPALAARAAIYVLEGMSRTHAIYAIRFLQQAVPDANLTLGSDTTQLIAWASPKDHETVKELVKQLIEESPDTARTAKVYNLKHATADIAIQTLSAALPEATVNPGADPSQLIAWARANDHKKIETIIEQLETKGPADTEPQAIVYTVPSSTATEAMRILRETVPQAKLTIGSEPHQLIAWARPADHEVIAQLVDKMGEKGPDELAPKVAVYKVEAGDADGAIAFLQAAVPNAQFSVGSDPRRLIAWASPTDHQVIQKAVDELTAGADQISTRVYRFEYADPAAANAVLSSLVPAANIALDENDGSLVVSAMPDDHAKIQATIDEMDSEDAGGQRPVVKVHPITVGDPANVYQSLVQLFSSDTNVQLTLDEQHDAVIAVAPAAKHKRIDDMIKAVAAVAQEDDDTTVELHSMKNVDSSAAMDVLDQLLAKQSSKAEVSYDYMSNQLVAIGRTEDHELIKKTLEQLRTEEKVVEVYELQYVDPMSAEMAISRQFADEGTGGPRVDIDPNSEQLFIRATAEQQQEIRELLIKMGETKLKLLKGRSGQIMRTYRTQGDISEALREIQRLWPQLRDNEIRIVSPDEPLPEESPKEPDAPPAKPEASPKEKPVEPPKEAATAEKPAEGNLDKPKPSTATEKDAPNKTSLLDDSAWGDDWYFVAQIQPDGAAEADAAQPKAPPVVKQKPPAKEPPKPAEPAPKQPPKTETAEIESKPPPLYVVPGEGSITVVSDDPEALQQFEQLLRTILPSAGQIGRNISVIELKNASASEVAERLGQLFGDARSSWRRGALPVAIVPDDRLNTLVVQGSRIDRQTIEGLVRVLDSDHGEGTKPQIIPLQYADAVEVSQVIQEVFRSQLGSTTTSRARTTTSTSRLRPGVAVDEMTNSLVVMATSPLLEEIIELANTLDERAGENPARRIKIIPLKKANATRVEEALQRILKGGSSTTRRTTP